MAIANSPLTDPYTDFWQTMLHLQLGSTTVLNKSLLMLVNDGLMAIFFLFVGLELKRELVQGELSTPRKAMLPMAAALGGMVVPAALFILFNAGTPSASGWGVPMATDIAFALGVLAVLGSRVPASLKVLLTAIAIVDDLGAILVIALFYTAKINLAALALAGVFLALLVGLNRLGFRQLSLYGLFGLPLWYFMLKSGIHATIAGVLLAFCIPLVAPRKDSSTATDEGDLDQENPTDSPAIFLETALLPWVSYLIVPVFAFANAGVAIGSVSFSNVSLGILLGLVCGKPLGIVGASWLAQRFGLAHLPRGIGWLDLSGLGFLAGIGFTMALFIGSLAFANEPQFANEAKVAILAASFLAALIGVGCFLFGTRTKASDRQSLRGQ